MPGLVSVTGWWHSVRRDPGHHFEPRSIATAARSATALTLLAAAVVLVFAVTGDHTLRPLPSFVVVLTLVGCAALLNLRRPPARSPMWVGVPLVGVALVVGLDMATEDASAGAQVFLCFPVLFAASQLRSLAAGAVNAAAIAGSAFIAFSLLPFDKAVSDVVFVGVTLFTMTVLLVHAADRQEALIEQLHALATVDPLTGLVTRRVLDEVARSTLARREESPGTGLIVLDIDRFKVINDTYGHPVGDDVLRHIADIMRERLRPTSVVCRIGGDEMAVLLPDCTARAAHHRAQDLLDAIRGQALNLEDGTELFVSVSAGVAHAPDDGNDLRSLYSVADARLYEAKRGGRARVGTG